MKPPPIQTITTTPRGTAQLKSLKLSTGIRNWNTLMRWAICTSLREESSPSTCGKGTINSTNEHQKLTGDSKRKLKADEVVSVNWHIFAGDYADEIAAVFWIRYDDENTKKTPIEPSEYFKRHLHRGLDILEATASGRDNHTALIEMALSK